MVERERYGITVAVFAGALVLVALPTAALLAGSLDAILRAVGIARPPPLQLVVGLLSISFGLKVATELTRVRLHGFAELHRGSPRRVLARHAMLAVPALVVIGYLGFLVVALAMEASRDANGLVVALFVATVVFFAVLVRGTLQAVLAGRRDAIWAGSDDPEAE